MWTETIYWWIGTIIFTLIGVFKEKFFDNNVSLAKDKQTIKKTKEIHIKTIKEQKSYIRARNNLGQDFITMVFSIVVFYVLFIILIYPNIPNLYTGIIAVLIFSAIFSYIYARFIVNTKHLWHSIINAFMNKLYVGSFLIYIKYFDTVSPLLLIIVSIVLMLGTNYLLEWINARKSV